MAVPNSHWTHPLTIGADGHIISAEQDSDAEILSCWTVILSWPLGTRELDPEFGIDEQAFLEKGADLDEIRQALQTYEPREIGSVTQSDNELAQLVTDIGRTPPAPPVVPPPAPLGPPGIV